MKMRLCIDVVRSTKTLATLFRVAYMLEFLFEVKNHLKVVLIDCLCLVSYQFSNSSAMDFVKISSHTKVLLMKRSILLN